MGYKLIMEKLRSIKMLIVLAAFLPYSSCFADVQEDYEAGAKSFQVGDYVTAVAPLRKAADAGHAHAQVLYGLVLYGFSADVEAVDYFKKSARQGHAEGQFYLGTSFISGEGTTKNLAEGRSWVLKSAKQGYVPAENQMALLGIANSDGQMSDVTIVEWLQKAADDNDFLPAVEALLMAYRDGKYGLAVDSKMSNKYERQAIKLRGLETKKKRRRRGEE